MGASTAIRLPATLSDCTRSNSRSCATAGKNGNSPSADHALGAEASNPACCNAVGQSWRRSTGTRPGDTSAARRVAAASTT
jgi:hypothetical protein